jgi:receptor expression-enhancing protein 5/6
MAEIRANPTISTEGYVPNSYRTYNTMGNSHNFNYSVSSFRKTLDEIEQRLRENKSLKTFYTRTKIPLTYTLGGAVMLALMLIYVFSGIRAITNVIGVIYPGYMSLKALNNKDTLQDMLWLSYWIWYGLFTMIESITDLFLFWIPMYEFFKMGFYIYLYAPNTKGSLFLYRKILQPLVMRLQQYEKQVIENVYEVKKTISDDSVQNTSTSNTTNTSTRLHANAPVYNPNNPTPAIIAATARSSF